MGSNPVTSILDGSMTGMTNTHSWCFLDASSDCWTNCILRRRKKEPYLDSTDESGRLECDNFGLFLCWETSGIKPSISTSFRHQVEIIWVRLDLINVHHHFYKTGANTKKINFVMKRQNLSKAFVKEYIHVQVSLIIRSRYVAGNCRNQAFPEMPR